MIEKQKVVVYVISSRGLLVFAHGAHPEVGYQVPSGTVRERETPLAAAMRELKEETGLQVDSAKFTKLGIFNHDMRPFKAERHIRHAYLLQFEDQTINRWTHWEMHPDTHDAAPVEFHFHWEPLHRFLPSLLSVGQGIPIARLCTKPSLKKICRLEYLMPQKKLITSCRFDKKIYFLLYLI